MLSAPRISPDGQHVAVLQAVNGIPAAVIYQVNAPAGTAPAIIRSTKWEVDGLRWAKNDRLILYVKQNVTAFNDDRMRRWTRAASVKPDGSELTMLLHDQLTLNNNPSAAHIVDVDPDDPNLIFMTLFVPNIISDEATHAKLGIDDDYFRMDLLKVDLSTGKSESAQGGTPETREWLMDGHGKVVGRIEYSPHKHMEHLKLSLSGKWQDGGDFDATGDEGAGVAGLTEDGKAMVRLVKSADATDRLVRTGLDSEAQTTVLFANEQYDVDDVLQDDWTGRVIGVEYQDDQPRYVYFDQARAALQNGLEHAFPNLIVHSVSMDLTRDKVIAGVEAPRTPPKYYFVDRTTHQATVIGEAYPGLKSEDLGEMKPYAYTARDGLSIHAYLTLPPGVTTTRNLPVVVMPHGGPDSRDSIGFDWWAQFLANRGYVVFQPNFRGSSGYGRKFTEAGLHQWGLKMQDDISDGVAKLIAGGIADPKRICIVGGSYGGYAALAGAAFTPDLYACAASIAGISDLPKVLSAERVDYGKDSRAVSFWYSRIGSSYDDGSQLRATSPALHADRVKCPILLMHGEGDTTVRIEQSEEMASALRSAGKDVRFVRFPGDDHYLNLADTRIKMLTELENFLAAHIGTASGTQASR